MASPRLSVVLVVAGVLAATAGGAYYFFAVFTTDERVREARVQVEKWEESWQEARRCVLGRAPLAATIDDAFTGRELILNSTEGGDEENKELADCARLLGRLTRPEGNNTGIERVEEAWQALEQHAVDVARRYVTHLQEPFEDQTFAAALQQLTAARAELRRLVKLGAQDGEMGPAPRELQLAPLAQGGEALTELIVAPAGAQLAGRAAIGERWLAVRMRRGEGAAAFAIEAHPVKPDVVAAVPEATWGAAAAFENKGEKLSIKLVAGALDGEGAVTAPVAVASAPSLIVGAALGSGPARAVLYVDGAVRAAVSKDAGASWKSSLLADSSDVNIFPGAAGHADVIWKKQVVPAAAAAAADDEGDGELEEPSARELDARSEVSWQRVSAAGLPALGAPQTLPAATLLGSCPAATAPWALVSQEGKLAIVRMDAPAEPIRVPASGSIAMLGCDDTTALLAEDQGRTLWTCSKGECRTFPWRGVEGIGAVIGGKAMYVAARRQLLAVLTADANPRLVRLPAGAALHALVELDGAPYLVLKQKAGALAAAPLPR